MTGKTVNEIAAIRGKPEYKVGGWLLLEVEKRGMYGLRPKIVGFRQTRPRNRLAIQIELLIPWDVLQPHAAARLVGSEVILDVVKQPEKIIEEILANPDPFEGSA